MDVFIHDTREHLRIALQSKTPQSIYQRLLGNQRKVLVTLHQGTQPRVLELLKSPNLGYDGSIPRNVALVIFSTDWTS